MLAAEPGGLVQEVPAVGQQRPGFLAAGPVMVAMIDGSFRSVVIAYCGSKSGPGPITATVCGLPPGAGQPVGACPRNDRKRPG